MYKLAHLLLLAPAALAGLVTPLQERETTCEAPLSACGSTCIGPLDICCPAAPNGEIIGCSGTDNCWINPDNSPACCPLFHNCPGQKAGDGVYHTMPTITIPTVTPTVPPVSPPPTINSEPTQQTTTTSGSTISTVKSVTPPVSVRPSSTNPVKSSTPYPKPSCTASGSSSGSSGSGSGSSGSSGSGSGSSPSASPVFNGASSSGSISIGGILGAIVLGIFL
ncbi:uncharacterized protein N7458_001368 [Penicillium daleae]|uniref:GPI anchored serine-threonine rich protein n=1 Tax=Penicillium daleae TaxID=63821 RepID=A0AAD6G595_9EURO|nr:uncharacterized protein N7458_001368 [Penicillium daleae]KAJ5459816.1 hypothetical protein N7458_001368 [Penicillium daleae]